MKTIYFVLVFFLLSTLLTATIINVPADQPTIQAGIDTATYGDTVLVQPGTYVENIDYNWKNITVASLFLTTQNTTYISSTIIDGNSSGSVVTFENYENQSAVLCGFTITNGYVSHGGGIFCENSSPSLQNVEISNNSTNGNGGGICCYYSSPTLTNVTITGNNASDLGGGIYCANSSPSLNNVTISGNSAVYGGGGICFQGNTNTILQNVTITGNIAYNFGGGIFCDEYSSPSLQNVTISGNSADSGGGIYCYSYTNPILQNVTITGNNASDGGGIYCLYASPSLINSILWNNLPQQIHYNGVVTVTYSDIEGGFTGTGNIDSDPLFVDPGSGDYHLQSISPCIDAGDPVSPFDPDGTIADMGAYYFPQFIYADFTADLTNGCTPLTVNFTDLSTPGTGVIDEWYWDFGNGNNSSLQNPSNEYFYRGSYTVSLTVTDDIDSTDTETKIDYITVLNSAPIVQNPITDFSFDEDTVDSSIDMNNVFDDADLPYGDVLSFSYSGNTYIDVSIVSGIVTLTPDPDWFGYEDITFTATDDQNAIISDEVIITVDPVNDPPILNITGTFEADEDLPSQVYDFSGFCSQVWGETDVLSLSATNSVHIDVTITDFDVVFESNTLNWNGTEYITIYLDDNIADNRDIVNQVIQVTINPINDAPTITLPDDFTFDEDGTLVEDFVTYIDDVDLDDLTLTVTGNTEITVDIIDLEVTLGATENWNGNEILTFTVDDGQGERVSFTTGRRTSSKNQENNRATADDDVEVIVLPVNDDPTIVLPDDFTFEEDDGLMIDFTQYVNDIDPDDLTLSVTGNTEITVDIVGLEVTFGATENWNGTETLTFIVDDNVTRATAEDDVDVIVTPVNDEPVLIGFLPDELEFTVVEDSMITFSVDVEDIDSTIEYEWFVDEVLQTESSEEFVHIFEIVGEIEIKSIASDEEYSIETIWIIQVEEGSDAGDILPVTTDLNQNYPNPFNPTTNINFSVAQKSSFVTINIYNIKGCLIKILVCSMYQPGNHSVVWDGTDSNGKTVSSGIYLYHMSSKEYSSTKKMILIK